MGGWHDVKSKARSQQKVLISNQKFTLLLNCTLAKANNMCEHCEEIGFFFLLASVWVPICMTHQKAFCRGSDQRLTEIQTVGRIKMAASLKRKRGSCSPRLSMSWILCARGDVYASSTNCLLPGTDRRRPFMLPSDLLPTSSINIMALVMGLLLI